MRQRNETLAGWILAATSMALSLSSVYFLVRAREYADQAEGYRKQAEDHRRKIQEDLDADRRRPPVIINGPRIRPGWLPPDDPDNGPAETDPPEVTRPATFKDR